MIMIDRKSINLNDIVNEHWNYFKDFIGYNDFPDKKKKKPTKSDENKKYRNEALRDIIGPSLYNDLQNIITKDLTFLRKIVKDNKHLCYRPKPVKIWEKKLEELGAEKTNYEKNLNSQRTVIDAATQDRIQKKIAFCSYRIKEIGKFIKEAKSFNSKEKKRFEAATTRKIWVFVKGSKGKKGKCKKKDVTLKDLLGYEDFYKGKDWNSHKLCYELGVDICPYCNRQYIYTVQKQGGDSLLATAQLDHFFPKDKYPLISFSFFNLIPSCYSCNHTKGDNTRKTIYPYEEEFGDDGKFALVDLENGKKITDLDTSQYLGVKINAQGDLKNEVIASDEVFQLTPLYNQHQTEICDFVERFKHFSGIKKNEVMDFKLISSNTEAENIILGMPVVLKERTFLLQKMKKDLLEELKNALEKELT